MFRFLQRENINQFSSVAQPCLTLCDPMECSTPGCPSPTPGAYSNPCPLSRWCHPTMSSPVIPFSSHLQSFPASESFPMSWFFKIGLSHFLICKMNKLRLQDHPLKLPKDHVQITYTYFYLNTWGSQSHSPGLTKVPTCGLCQSLWSHEVWEESLGGSKISTARRHCHSGPWACGDTWQLGTQWVDGYVILIKSSVFPGWRLKNFYKRINADWR